MKLTKCFRCSAVVWMAETERGKTMPINNWQSPSGKIVIIPGDEHADKPLIHFLKKDETVPEGTPRYVSHMSTCKGRR